MKTNLLIKLVKPFSLTLSFIIILCLSVVAQKSQLPQLKLSNVQKVSRLTGTPLKGEQLPSPNNTAQNYDVGGTDLGIFWQMKGDKVGIFFGDTHGREFIAEKGAEMEPTGDRMFWHFPVMIIWKMESPSTRWL